MITPIPSSLRPLLSRHPADERLCSEGVRPSNPIMLADESENPTSEPPDSGDP